MTTINAMSNGRVPKLATETHAPPTTTFSTATIQALQSSAPALEDLSPRDARLYKGVTDALPNIHHLLQLAEQAIVQGDSQQALAHLQALLAPGLQLDTNAKQLEQRLTTFNEAYAAYQKVELSVPLNSYTALDPDTLMRCADALDAVSDAAGEFSAIVQARVNILHPQT